MILLFCKCQVVWYEGRSHGSFREKNRESLISCIGARTMWRACRCLSQPAYLAAVVHSTFTRRRRRAAVSLLTPLCLCPSCLVSVVGNCDEVRRIDDFSWKLFQHESLFIVPRSWVSRNVRYNNVYLKICKVRHSSGRRNSVLAFNIQ